MQVLEKTEYSVEYIVSDNVLLAQDSQGTHLLLYGSGIGVNAREGGFLEEPIRVEESYEVNAAAYVRMLAKTDRRIVAVCENAIHLIHARLEEKLDPQIHISLTKHIAILSRRLRRQEGVSNPALVQTEILYHEEFQLARMVVPYLEKELDLDIPDEEIGFIALYIYGARYKGKRRYSIRYAYLANAITEFLEKEFHREVDKESLAYVRLVTHLRFAIERVTSGRAVTNLLLEQIQEDYKEAYEIAAKAVQILERELGCCFPEDEIAFLALYVEQLRQCPQ